MGPGSAGGRQVGKKEDDDGWGRFNKTRWFMDGTGIRAGTRGRGVLGG